MDERLSKLLDNLVSLLEKTGEFVLEQAPPLAQEIIAYGRATTSITVASGIVFLIAFIFISRSNIKADWDEIDENPEMIFRIIANIGTGLLGVMLVALNTNNCLMAWVAPRLYLLKTIKSML